MASLSKAHKAKISKGLKKYHQTCRTAKRGMNRMKRMRAE